VTRPARGGLGAGGSCGHDGDLPGAARRKEPGPGDPGLTGTGRTQAARTAWWLRDFGLNAVYSSPQRRAWETGEIIASAGRAGERLRAFLLDVIAEPGPVAAVTHGGVTVDLLRTLLGDGGLPRGLLEEGVPPCAVTTLRDLEVLDIASVVHLGR
jgi:broad specificity phosphatase PhoE